MNLIEHGQVGNGAKTVFLNLYQKEDLDEYWLISTIFTWSAKYENVELIDMRINGSKDEATEKFLEEMKKLKNPEA